MAKANSTGGEKTPSPSIATLPPSAAAKNPRKPVSDDERRSRISEAAYYRAERRGFEPGSEEHDWLEAEKDVDRGTPTDKKPEANDFPSPK